MPKSSIAYLHAVCLFTEQILRDALEIGRLLDLGKAPSTCLVSKQASKGKGVSGYLFSPWSVEVCRTIPISVDSLINPGKRMQLRL